MIPARSGSKRIPKKNIKDFCGKPIITYPIEIAKESGIFDDIIVYTDDKDLNSYIKAINQKATIWSNRPWDSDNETITETVLNFLKEYSMTFGEADIDYLCILLPTAVFVNPIDIFDLIHGTMNYDCVITFCKYSHPIQRAFKFKSKFYSSNVNVDKIEMINKKNEFKRTQDLTPSYYDAGQMYFLNVKSFLEQKKIFMKNIYPIIIDAIDIDNQEDWGKAEAFYKYKIRC